jgi:phosphate butyryltransferase
MSFKSLEDLAATVLESGLRPRVAIAPCEEEFVLRSAVEAQANNVAEPVLVGNHSKTMEIAQKYNLDISQFEFHEEPEPPLAVQKAIDLYRSGKVALIMKGLISTSIILKAILNKKTGVPPQGLISHVSVFKAPKSDRLMLLTDAAVNIKPNLQRKVDILCNALDVARKLGITCPKAAVLAATEKVNYPAMPATLDAQILSQMASEGAFGDAIVAGPLQLDLAVSPVAAACKGITDPVAGHADLLVAQDIESANILYKSLTTIAGICVAGVVVGSSVPIVVPSRGDSERTKYFSIVLASYLSQKKSDQICRARTF